MGGIRDYIQLSILNERCYTKEESVNSILQDAFSLRNILSKFSSFRNSHSSACHSKVW